MGINWPLLGLVVAMGGLTALISLAWAIVIDRGPIRPEQRDE